MRTMYDSTDVEAIPAGATMVAGYVGGAWATYEPLRERFPAATVVSIAVNAGEDAQVLDVESGDATPDEVPAWATRQRARGQIPTVYASTDTWPAVVAACQGAGVELPEWWEAHYDGDPTLSPGSVAKQYRSDTASNLDYSSVAGYWPGVDAPSQGDDMPRPSDAMDYAESRLHPGAVLILHADGGVELRGFPPGADWDDYIAFASDGSFYAFGPGRNGGVVAYPGLPAADRLGSRYFTRIALG